MREGWYYELGDTGFSVGIRIALARGIGGQVVLRL